MNSLKLILLLLINGFLAQTRTKKGVAKNSPIFCVEDKHCTVFQFEGAVCKNHTCVCEDETVCKMHKTDMRVKSTILGEECTENDNCNIQYAICSDKFCVCPDDRVSSIDGRKCLKVSDGLGKFCEEDIQCVKKTQGSVCSNSICVCDEYHNQDPDLDECINKVGLGQPCELQSECIHISHAQCGKFHCECKAGFVQTVSRNKCLPLATQPLDQCEEDVQCKEIFSRGGICFHGRCECDDVHRVANRTVCPSRLKLVCENDEECKSYNEDMSIICDKGRCECAPSFAEQDGFCNGCELIKSSIFLTVFTILFALLLRF